MQRKSQGNITHITCYAREVQLRYVLERANKVLNISYASFYRYLNYTLNYATRCVDEMITLLAIEVFLAVLNKNALLLTSEKGY